VVAVGPRRDVVGREVLARFGRRVLVLDDGFQHLRLARDLDVLCVSGEDEADWPLPAGRLREFAGAAERADVRVRVLEAGQPADAASVCARRRPAGFFGSGGGGGRGGGSGGAAARAPRRAALISGLARPERFEADVRGLGIDVVSHARFPDHHRFAAAELLEAARAAAALGAEALVTTAKDALRLPSQPPPLPLLVFRSELELLDAASFLERLLRVARAA
jgi:tetraacyldisaccharide 4'-kinase